MSTPGTVSLSDEVDAFLGHDPVMIHDPYPFYRRLREEQPVYRHADRVIVASYHEAKAVLAAPNTLQGIAARGTRYRNAAERHDADRRRELAEMFGFLEKRLGGANGAHHARMRKLAQSAFTPRMIAQMEERIIAIASELLAPIAARPTIELIGDFAYHLPLIVISEMLDIPTHDREDLRRWANDLGQFVGADWSSPDAVERTYESVFRLRSYLGDVFESRRGGPTTDLLGALIAAEGDGGDRFTEDELIAMITQFVFAGHETTTNLVGSGMVRLLGDHRDQWELLCGDPARIPLAVEEMLRYDPPAQNVEKMAHADGRIGGVPVRRFDTISVFVAAANRDPVMFDDPERFDTARARNSHLTFGFGAHHCIGAALARLEAVVTFRLLTSRFPEMTLASDTVDWRPNHMLRGPRRLPLRLGG